MSVKEFREKTIEELREELLSALKESAQLRMGKRKETFRPHMLRGLRSRIAQIKTIINEKMRVQG